MAQLTPIELADGRLIYIEVEEDAIPPDIQTDMEQRPITRDGKREHIIQSFEVLKGTISAYTSYTLDAFKELANANVNKVTLEFGVKVAGEAGIPYVTKGTAESNLKITVECTFPDAQKRVD